MGVGKTVQQVDVVEMVQKDYDWLMCIARKFSREENAEDLCQQSVESMLRHADSFSGGAGCFRAWSYVIIKNTSIKNARANKKRETTFSTWKTGVQNDDLESSEPPPCEISVEEETVGTILEEVKHLSPAYRKAIVLHIDGLEDSEIADTLDIAAGTVKSRLHRARKSLYNTLSAAGILDGTSAVC